MTQKEILGILEKTNALLTGHFKLSSGLHSNRYLQCALALQHPKYAEKLGKALADRFRGENTSCVAGPALGGIIIAHEVAKALKARCVFGEREPESGKMVFRRGFRLTPQDRVLAVEDVITTGKSIKELIEAIRPSGAAIIGIGALANRSFEEIDFRCPAQSLLKLDIKVYDPQNCPLCKEGIPLAKPGSRIK